MSNGTTPGIGLTIGQIVLEHAHFSHRDDFLNYPPNALQNVELGTEVQVRLFEGAYHVPDNATGRVIAGVSVRVLTKTSAPAPLYSFDVAVMALVIADSPDPALPPLEFVAQSGFATVFPFLRESVANLTMRGRFGPIWLKPVNILTAVADAVAFIKQRQSNPPNSARSTRKPASKK
jgi:preprotein translocase subunit SecB